MQKQSDTKTIFFISASTNINSITAILFVSIEGLRINSSTNTKMAISLSKSQVTEITKFAQKLLQKIS